MFKIRNFFIINKDADVLEDEFLQHYIIFTNLKSMKSQHLNAVFEISMGQFFIIFYSCFIVNLFL